MKERRVGRQAVYSVVEIEEVRAVLASLGFFSFNLLGSLGVLQPLVFERSACGRCASGLAVLSNSLLSGGVVEEEEELLALVLDGRVHQQILQRYRLYRVLVLIMCRALVHDDDATACVTL
jgi:hypothetical protein